MSYALSSSDYRALLQSVACSESISHLQQSMVEFSVKLTRISFTLYLSCLRNVQGAVCRYGFFCPKARPLGFSPCTGCLTSGFFPSRAFLFSHSAACPLCGPASEATLQRWSWLEALSQRVCHPNPLLSPWRAHQEDMVTTQLEEALYVNFDIPFPCHRLCCEVMQRVACLSIDWMAHNGLVSQYT